MEQETRQTAGGWCLMLGLAAAGLLLLACLTGNHVPSVETAAAAVLQIPRPAAECGIQTAGISDRVIPMG